MQQVKPAMPLDVVCQIPDIATLCRDADHIDIKCVTGEVELREFLTGAITYSPSWLTFLYRVRKVFVRFLGMKQEGVPEGIQVQPEEISFTPGEKYGFFNVVSASENHYYVAGARDSHLTAYLAVVHEAESDRTNRFYVATIVHYHNWTGPVYFNVIRPFHHLVVRQMAKAGINYTRSS